MGAEKKFGVLLRQDSILAKPNQEMQGGSRGDCQNKVHSVALHATWFCIDATNRLESMAKIRKLPKKSLYAKSNRKGSDWVAEIGPVPSAPEQPIKSGNETIEIDKWLKLVESYWQRERLRKA